MKFGICNEIFKNWPLEETMAFVAKTGYDAIEIAPFTLQPYVTLVDAAERQRLRDLAKRHGLSISAIHWVLAQTEGLHLTHPDLDVRKRTSQYLRDLIDFCADIGGQYIVVGSPKQRQILPGIAPEQAWDWATEVFRGALAKAGERAVTLCLEPLASSETNFINTASEAVRFIQQFKDSSLKIILDVKAMSSESLTIPNIIRNSWPHFAYFHANDANLKGPGFGAVDFKPIAAALREVGYNGYVSVEVFNFEEGPEVIATRSLEYLTKIFA